jgi:hypothetical protein
VTDRDMPTERPSRRDDVETQSDPGFVESASDALRGITRDDQGHIQIGPSTTAPGMIEAYRQMAREATNVANECLSERRKTNEELARLRAIIQLGMRPVGYVALIAIVASVAVAQFVMYLQLRQLMQVVAALRPS